MAEVPRSGCPINAAVEVLGDRWTLLILRDMVFGDRRHFRRLQSQSAEGIASNILADRLRTLVETGLLTRDDAGRGQRATYTLTEAAIQLVPVLVHLGAWGARNRPTSPELRAGAELMEAEGPELWNDLMAELRERHLGVPRPDTGGPTATERLAAYAEAITGSSR
ncbi:HxlR family transcriptional regulator [Actinomadura pelletieri DSM 43383]|uniref:HxlR family transcriptional regulator n=1 Tax=Actinomadura pelletieri DSM 43383 TaxID=1120940 RepID=A0A495QGN0_9ACTN|nr:helix-turn-helix domain-containing protein [Actinomadura pelletieri]RKS71077.1 HxlR family transcriptional regulator [Actinomadura pelletieri DSM 43383]